MLPKGVRQHNPGNIEYSPKNKWQGAAEQPAGERFAVFQSPVWGLRALAVLLITYYDKYDCDTVSKIIKRWAPSHENPTDKYAAHVAARAGVLVDEPIDVHSYAVLSGLLRGVVTFENGSGAKHGRPVDWYEPETYDEALKRAGVVSAAKAKTTSQDVAQGAAAAGIGVAAVWEVGSRMIENSSPFVQQVGAAALGLAAVAAVVAWWRHNKDRRAERL